MAVASDSWDIIRLASGSTPLPPLLTMELSDSLLQGKYPAKTHAAKVAAYLKENGTDLDGVVFFIEGQKTHLIEDNDEPRPFRYGVGQSKQHGAS